MKMIPCGRKSCPHYDNHSSSKCFDRHTAEKLNECPDYTPHKVTGGYGDDD